MMSSFFCHRKLGVLASTVIFSIVLNGCASVYKPQSNTDGVITSAPKRPEIGEVRKRLRSLPPPAGRITAAVYGFGDLTGQNKPSPASGLSSAVTQGASSSLVGLMLESGWFRPVERVGLQSVLSERNLWAQRLSAQQRASLEPLPPASIIFEGGIVAYEFNTRTGGLGAKYLGIGGSKEYREDVLTVSLRAVNAQSGMVLSSVTSTKRIYSQAYNAGIFGFVDNDKILEIEGGSASNESVQAGLEEAIAFALIDLIADGLTANIWQLRDAELIRSDIFAQFLSDDDIEEYISKKGVQPSKSEGGVDSPEPTLEQESNAKNTEIAPQSNQPKKAASEMNSPESLKPVDNAISTEVAPESKRPTVSSEPTVSGEPSNQGVVTSWTETPLVNNKIEQGQASAGSRLVESLTLAPTTPLPPEDESTSEVELIEEVLPLVTPADNEEPSQKVSAEIIPVTQEATSNGNTASDKPAANKVIAAENIKYIVVGYSEESSAMIDFQRWLDDRYNGVEVGVILSKDKAAYQVAIGPFEDESDMRLVGEDLKSQGLPIIEALQSLDDSRQLPVAGPTSLK